MTEVDALDRAFQDLLDKAQAVEQAKVTPKNARSPYYHPERVAARASDFAKAQMKQRGLA